MSALTKASTSADTEVTIATEVHPTAEENFCLFYHRTARGLRAYLRRMLADPSHADDLLQESYLRLLRAKLPADMSDDHQKNYLFRIATNLLRDQAAQNKTLPITGETQAPERVADAVQQREDLRRAMNEVKPRERELLWLAYVERFNHDEIATIVGAKTQSIRPMLSRARANLSEVLRRMGLTDSRR